MIAELIDAAAVGVGARGLFPEQENEQHAHRGHENERDERIPGPCLHCHALRSMALDYGIATVQNIDQFGLEVFLGARYEILTRAFASYHPIIAVMGGGRLRF